MKVHLRLLPNELSLDFRVSTEGVVVAGLQSTLVPTIALLVHSPASVVSTAHCQSLCTLIGPALEREESVANTIANIDGI